MKLSEIKQNPENPRIIKDDKFKKLCESIRSFPEMMSLRPIIIDENNIIQGGNMRFKALKELGYTEISDDWVKQGKELTPEQWREFVIKDNVGFGEWDFEELKSWDSEKLTEWGLDLPDFHEEVSAEDGEDNIPEFLHENVIKKGDLIEMNNHRLLCGDSCNIDDINKLINGKQSDLSFNDPPYDLEDGYSNFIVSSAKNDSHIFIMNSDKLLIKNIENNEEFFRKMFFVDFRQARLVSNNQPMTRVDPIAEFCKGKTTFNNLKDGFSTLIECCKIHNDDAKQNHGFKQAKKVELPETFILHYSKPNQLIFDFFGGSGSTLIACEKDNRICYTNEFEPAHCDIILKRWILYMKEHSKLFEVKINGEQLDQQTIEILLN